MNILKNFDLAFVSEGINLIAGVDEAGRGPLAGPVVAAAVIFDKKTVIKYVNDSKKINANKRELLSNLIKEKAITYGFGIIDHNIIDEINILQATLRAMKEAVNRLNITPNLILIDGNKSFTSKIKTQTIVKGDSKSFSIAAASILAKVKRDEIMKNASSLHPEYFWDKNKGYGTKQHIAAIKEFGFTALHRKSFLRKILDSKSNKEII